MNSMRVVRNDSRILFTYEIKLIWILFKPRDIPTTQLKENKICVEYVFM